MAVFRGQALSPQRQDMHTCTHLHVLLLDPEAMDTRDVVDRVKMPHREQLSIVMIRYLHPCREKLQLAPMLTCPWRKKKNRTLNFSI